MAGSKGVPGRHGVEVVVEELSASLAARGHEVTVFGWRGYSDPSGEHRGARLEGTPGPLTGASAMPVHSMEAFSLIARRRASFDLVHIHSVDPLLFAGRLPSLLPSVVTSHGRAWEVPGVDPFRRRMSRLAEKRFLALPCPASAVSEHLAGLYRALGREVEVIPNGMRDLGTAHGRVFSRLPPLPRGYAVFAAGRNIPAKGLHILLEAWRLASPGCDLVIAGPPASGRYAGLLERLAPGSGVIEAGLLEAADLGDLLRGAAFGVIPSLAEAQSMALLDMLAIGIPLIYSDIPGNVEAAGSAGLQFRTGDAGSLAEAVQAAVSGRVPRSDAFRGKLAPAHDWRRIAASYESLYETALGDDPGR